MGDVTGGGGAKERKVFYPAVILGLGGTGQSVCGRMKRMMLARFGRVPPHIRLLAFDSHRGESTGGDVAALDTHTERITLELQNTREVLRNLRTYHPWFPDDPAQRMTLQTGDKLGASRTRPIGRLLLANDWATVHGRLKQAHGDLRGRLQQYDTDQDLRKEFERVGLEGFAPVAAEPMFLIVCNLVSGTGSGAFLDIAYVIRCIAENLRVLGFFSIPPESDTDHRHLCNAVAALRELQHFLSPEVYEYPTRRYEIYGTGAAPIVTVRGDVTAQPPYNLVGLSRPSDASEASVKRVEENTAQFLFDLTCSIHGVQFATDLINLPVTETTATGDRPTFFAFGSFTRQEAALDVLQAAKFLLADFIIDDISGESNPGEEQLHVTWAKDHVAGALKRVRGELGLPEASSLPVDFENLAKAQEVCSVLIDKVKDHVARRGFEVPPATNINSVNPAVLADVVLEDPTFRALFANPNPAFSELIGQIPRRMENLHLALQNASAEVVRAGIDVTVAEVVRLYAQGASAKQIVSFVEQVRQECETLRQRIQRFGPKADSPFAADSLKALFQQQLKKLKEWVTGGGQLRFKEEMIRQLKVYVDNHATRAAIEALGGFPAAPGRSMRHSAGGIDSLDLSAGLIGSLAVVHSCVNAMSVKLQDAGRRIDTDLNIMARGVRVGLHGDDLKRMLATGRTEYFGTGNQERYRRMLLDRLGAAETPLLLSRDETKVETIGDAVRKVAQECLHVEVQRVEGVDFDTWWRGSNLSFGKDDFDNSCTIKINDARAANEGVAPQRNLAIRATAKDDSTAVKQITGVADKAKFTPGTERGSVSMLLAKGFVVLPWIEGFDSLTNPYIALNDVELERSHTVPKPFRLRPIRERREDQHLTYLTACALRWVKAVKDGAVYEYPRSTVGLGGAVASTWKYCDSADVDSPRGPIVRLFAPIPGAGGPENPIVRNRAGRDVSVGSVAQHIRLRLMDDVLAMARSSQSEREQRVANLVRLLYLYVHALRLKITRGRPGEETDHFTNVDYVESAVAPWILGTFGTVDRAGVQAISDELVRKAGEADFDLEQEIDDTRLKLGVAAGRAKTPAATERASGGSAPEDPRGKINAFLKDLGLTVAQRAEVLDGFDTGRLKGLIQAASTHGVGEKELERLTELAIGK